MSGASANAADILAMVKIATVALLLASVCSGARIFNGVAKKSIAAVVSSYIALSGPLPSLALTTLETGPSRFTQAAMSLKDLNNDWENTVKSDPDNVRRVLGTVFTPPTCSKPLCGFESFCRSYAKAHIDDISDMEEYDTLFLKAQEALTSADFLAYSAVFSEYGNGGGGKDYIQLSRTQVRSAIEALDGLDKLINNTP